MDNCDLEELDFMVKRPDVYVPKTSKLFDKRLPASLCPQFNSNQKY